MNINIGENVKINATVVDFNEGTETVKLRIKGLQEDNCTPTEKYIRMKYEDLNNDDSFCHWTKSHIVKNIYKSNTHLETYDGRVLDWNVCPYCGKKISVTE